MQEAAIALIGGTGFYSFLENGEDISVDTPYGEPSAPVRVGEFLGKKIAFLPRHGPGHRFMPAEVPYRANLWALHSLGVRQVIAFNTVGSLQRSYRKGHFALVDQFVDRTHGRQDSFFSGTQRAHISAAWPYCERMREVGEKALSGADATVHPRATVVVIAGPRFSTAAESRWFSSQGWHLVNMTQYPEVILARELEMCYTSLAYITDYDVAASEVIAEETTETAVTHAKVLQEFSARSDLVLDLIRRFVGALPEDTDCACRHALDGARA
jgi:5'-methylthioadenosine phosphorylase